MASQRAHPSGIDALRPDPRPGIPKQLQASYLLWLVAVAAGVFETALVVVDATFGEVGSPAEVAVGVTVRLLAFTGLVVLAVQLRRGRNWARVALAVLYGGLGTLSLVIGPVTWLAGGGIADRRGGRGRPGVGAVCGQPGRAPGGGHGGVGAAVPPGRQRLPPSIHTGCRGEREAAGTGRRRRGQVIDVGEHPAATQQERAWLREVTMAKLPDLNTADLDAAGRIVAGTPAPRASRTRKRMRRICIQRPNNKWDCRWLQVLPLGLRDPDSFERAVSTPEPTEGRHEEGDRVRVPVAGRVMQALRSREEDRWGGLEHMAGRCPTSTMPHEPLSGAAGR
jgi:hypothetical protein